MTPRRVLRTVLLTFVFTGSLIAVATAQPAVATLTGRVVDTQLAATPGASVTVRSLSTSTTWTASSDDNGRFSFPMLPPGVYGVEVALSGFVPWRAEAVTLQVGQDRQLDVQLYIGNVQEGVVVRGDTRPVSTVVDGVLPRSAYRVAAAQRPELPRARAAHTGQRADTGLRSDQDQQRAHRLRRADGTRRQHHDRRPGQQRRRRRGTAAESADRCRAGVSDRDEPLRRRPRTLGLVGHQRRDALGHQYASGFGGASLLETMAGRLCRRRSTTRTRPRHSTGNRCRPRSAGRCGVIACSGSPPANSAIRTARCSSGRGTRPRARSRGASRPRRYAMVCGRCDSIPVAQPAASRLATPANGPPTPPPARSSVRSGRRRSARTRPTATTACSAHGPPRRRSNFVNALSASVSTFLNETLPVPRAPQLTFPSLQDGASFRMPQETKQTRIQIAENATLARGAHSVRLGGELQRVDAEFGLGVFRRAASSSSRTSRASITPATAASTTTTCCSRSRSAAASRTIARAARHRQHAPRRLRAGRLERLEPAAAEPRPALRDRHRRQQPEPRRRAESDRAAVRHRRAPARSQQPLAPRRLRLERRDPDLLVRGGYGIYYDRSSCRSSRSSAVSTAARCRSRSAPATSSSSIPRTGRLPPFAPTLSNPFTGFILPGAGASGINIIDPHLQNPTVHEFHLGIETRVLGTNVRVDGMHNQGVHFLIGRTVGEVFNPVVGGPDRVVNIESSARTKYDALLMSAERQFAGRSRLPRRLHAGEGVQLRQRRSDPVPQRSDRSDRSPARVRPDAERPAPSLRGVRQCAQVGGGVSLAALWTISSGVPMDIMMPDGQSRVPTLQRNAGGRQFHTARELNAFITQTNAAGGIDGVLLPLVPDSARFNDSFNSLDIRVSRPFQVSARCAHRADARGVQSVQHDQHPRHVERELLRVRECAGAGFRSGRTPGFLRSSALRPAGDDSGRRLRVGWTARDAVSRPSNLLSRVGVTVS